MKKFIASLLTVCMIVTSAIVGFPMIAFAGDANATITVTDLDSLQTAFNNVSEGGTITVNGDFVIPESTAGYVFGSNTGKTYTITGGSFDFTALTSSDVSRGFVYVKDNITFENTTFKFDSEKNDYIFASGYNLTIAETVKFEGAKVCFYGGILNGGCSSVNATLLAGNYTTINATSNSKQTISGDVNIHIGGNATANDILGNSGGCTVKGDITILVDGNATASGVYGGGNGGTINGNTYVAIGGNAKVTVHACGAGSSGTILGNTNVKVCDNADVKMVYGGGTNGTVKGNTFVAVTDNANTACDESSHSMTYGVFGGGTGGTIEGSTNVLFTGNAKANYIWGGCKSGGTVLGGTNITMSENAKTMSMYGGGYGVAQSCDANVTLLGGTLEQIFGGCQSQAFTGDVTVKLLGGTVKRRVYGGCYNETSGLSFATSYSVTGNITLVIDSKVNVDYSSSENDRSIYAHSRHKSPSSTENSAILFTDSVAYNAYNGKLKAQDTAMKLIMGSTSAADSIHTHTYTLSGNTVTQTCTCGNTATATITANNAIYSGKEINASVEYSDNWEYDNFDIAYSDNVNAGTATATFSVYNNQIHSANYEIIKATQKAPAVRADNNTINGLTTDMEYSTNGVNYYKVTDPAMTFESGKYYVRYAAVGNNVAASPATKVFFGNGISANKVNALKGQTVEIIVNMPTNSGISALDLAITYDKDALTLDKVTVGNVVAATYADGKLTWSGEATTKTGVLAKLTFTVSETAGNGSYAITLTQNGMSIENGEINVVEYVIGDVGGNDGKITSADVTALRAAIANSETGTLSEGADANGDGIVNTQDLVVIRQYIANYDYDTGESSIVLGKAQ